MRDVKIRAKSVLKLDTGQSNLDYTYDKGASVDEIAKHMLHGVIFNKGKAGAQKFIDDFMATYKE